MPLGQPAISLDRSGMDGCFFRFVFSSLQSHSEMARYDCNIVDCAWISVIVFVFSFSKMWQTCVCKVTFFYPTDQEIKDKYILMKINNSLHVIRF